MLVREADGMTKFVGCGPVVEESEVHGRLIERDVPAIGADVGPRAIARIEGDTNLGTRRVVEIKIQVRDSAPPACLLARGGAVGGRAADKADLQGGTVHPRLADR
jgi:hypothetical protein